MRIISKKTVCVSELSTEEFDEAKVSFPLCTKKPGSKCTEHEFISEPRIQNKKNSNDQVLCDFESCTIDQAMQCQ